MPTKTEAIAKWLSVSTHRDLADLYNPDMECQVNVAQDEGERISGEYRGRKWIGWTDGITTWKPFRIPRNASTDPEYEDSEIKFDLAKHAEGIGLTGWDWKNKLSRWVAFDFDSLINHGKGLTVSELDEIRRIASEVEWVTIRKSTSGRGLHLYIFLEGVETANHTEHAALARAILGTLSAITGHDFQAAVDCCGGNMWVWHRKMSGTDGLTLIKQGCALKHIPPNWKDHLTVVSGKRRKNLPQQIEQSAIDPDIFEQLCGQRAKIPLDEDHQKVISFLRDNDLLWWWDQDHHMLVTHTVHLKRAHEELQLRGFFDTNSPATNLNEQNCFCFPLRGGIWGVRRYTLGIQEHESWEQDGAGWTRCYLNKKPDLRIAARAGGGVEDDKFGFNFREAEVMQQSAALLGIDVRFGKSFMGRPARMSEHKDGRLVISIERKETDDGSEMPGWLAKKKEWVRIFNAQTSDPVESEVGNYDDLIRHLVTGGGEDCGWMIKSSNLWREEPLTHVKLALGSLGLKQSEANTILGQSVTNCWKLVCRPFQPEYPGDREWNRKAAQFRFTPTLDLENLSYPHWDKILKHCGEGLDEAVRNNQWARSNGIMTGADYLKVWIASLFQHPNDPLPYLFLYSAEQNTGKSILHEALSLLVTGGYVRADAALVSQGGFNAELEGAVVCVVEELDLRKNTSAYNRIKDWVTSREVLIHPKFATPYQAPNTTHWIHCANSHNACPVFPGDTRITMMRVKPLDLIELIPKKKFLAALEKEAPDFLAAILSLDIPDSADRLNVPVIVTEDKLVAEHLNKSPVELFLEEHCKPVEGCKIKFSELFERFQQTLDANDFSKYTKQAFGKDLPPMYPKGRSTTDAQLYVGNIAWKTDANQYAGKYVLKDIYLVKREEAQL
jgi:hypothetical protein